MRSAIHRRVRQSHTFLPGRAVELGAEFLHGDTTALSMVVERLGLRTRQAFTWAHGDGGPSDKPAPDGGVAAYFVGSERRLVWWNEPDERLARLCAALDRIHALDPDAVRSDERSIAQFLVDEGVCPVGMAMARAGFANTVAGDIDALSLRVCSRFDRAWAACDGEGEHRVQPSMAAVVAHLAAGLCIRTDFQVHSIVAADGDDAAASAAGAAAAPETAPRVSTAAPLDSGKIVTITSKRGDVVRARAVVVAVPLPILKDGDIHFSPPLPPAKVDALSRMRMSNAVKLMLKVKRRFWPEKLQGVR
jgi:monoamine oxidase